MIKIKMFRASNDTINCVKRQFIRWEKIFVNHTSGNVLIPRMYRELKLNNNKIKTTQFKNRQRT